MKKQISILVISLFILLSLGGCGKNEDTSDTTYLYRISIIDLERTEKVAPNDYYKNYPDFIYEEDIARTFMITASTEVGADMKARNRFVQEMQKVDVERLATYGGWTLSYGLYCLLPKKHVDTKIFETKK